MKILLLRVEKPEVSIMTPEHIKQIQGVDASVEIYAPLAGDQAEVTKHLADCDVVSGFPYDLAELEFQDAKNLKWIHTLSAGVDKVLTPYVKESQLLVSNSSGVHAIPIAEHVLAFMLIFAKKFYESFEKQQQKLWQGNDGMFELRGSTLLVIGLGRVGSEIAKVAYGIGMNVIAVDRSKKKPAYIAKMYGANALRDALPEADFAVLALPHTVDTHHLFDMEKFRIMKDTAVLINIGRGSLLHEQELIEALEKKVIAGAALDVTEKEPLAAGSPLWSMKNVIITPHHSSQTDKRMGRMIDQFCTNIQAYTEGRPLPNLVDKQKGY
jgi:D-2-hydroxyacid dehydrogenase (NADP+)